MISFGGATEKGWDIQVSNEDGQIVLFQVKSITRYSRNRSLSRLVRGFDQLIVLTLDYDFFPMQVFLFEDSSVFFGESKQASYTVPCIDDTGKIGSKIFRDAKDISTDFFDCLSREL